MAEPALSSQSESLPELRKEAAVPSMLTEQQLKAGVMDSVRNTVLNLVVEGEYERAFATINRKVDQLQSIYPQYRGRVEHYVKHAGDLIEAIETKRTFPGLKLLSSAKQEELSDKNKEHFSELQFILERLEQIESAYRRSDLRSTVWIVNASVYCFAVLFVVGLYQDFAGGLAHSLWLVIQAGLEDVISWVFSFFGI